MAERKNSAEATSPEAAQRSSEAAQRSSQAAQRSSQAAQRSSARPTLMTLGCDVVWNERSDPGCVLTFLRGPACCQAPGMQTAERWNQSTSVLL